MGESLSPFHSLIEDQSQASEIIASAVANAPGNAQENSEFADKLKGLNPEVAGIVANFYIGLCQFGEKLS